MSRKGYHEDDMKEFFQLQAMSKMARRKMNLPLTYEEYALRYGVSRQTIYHWNKRWTNVKKASLPVPKEDKPVVVVPKEGPEIDWEHFDTKEFLKQNSFKVARALVDACVEKKSAPALQAFYKVMGLWVDKEEKKVTIDGSFYTRLALEAERELEAGSRVSVEGVDKVQEVIPLLSEVVCLPTGQGERTDS